MASDTENPEMNARTQRAHEGFEDLTRLFAAQDNVVGDDVQTEQVFITSVMESVREHDRRRRSVLVGFGMLGGLIAGSQFPSLLALLGRVLPSSADLMSASAVQANLDNMVVGTALLMFALVMTYVTLAEPN